jgi:trigger factor
MASSLAACGGSAGNDVTDATESTESASGSSAAGVVAASSAFDLKGSDYVTLCDYSNIEVTITGDYYITDDEIMDYYAQVIESYGPFYTADDSKTTIEEGDIVNVDYVGKLDGEAFSGGTATSQNIDVSGNCSADGSSTYIEGFTDGLLGAKVGDEIDCDVTFPESYGNTDLAGKAVVFTFTVNSIQREVTLDDVDDTFAQEQFSTDTLAELNSTISSYFTYYKQQDTMTAIQDYLLENCEVDVPEDFVEARYDDYKRVFIEEELDGDETQLEDYASSYYNMTLEEMEAQWKENVEDTVRLQLIMDAIVDEMKLVLVEDEFSAYVDQLVSSGSSYGYYSDAEEMYAYYGYGDAAYGEKYLRDLYLYDQALEAIEETATVNVVPEEE